ncbi:hypothetical protein C8J57DRAFT_1480375, partial [Mycena rebaudengoi]
MLGLFAGSSPTASSFASNSGSISKAAPSSIRNKGADFSDITRRVCASGSVTGRGWEVRVDGGDSIRNENAGENEGGEGMILVRKGKTRGRVDTVFGDMTNTHAAQSNPNDNAPAHPKEGKDNAKDSGRWWNLTRGRKDKDKDTVGSSKGLSLGLGMRRPKSPAPSEALSIRAPPTTPTLEAQQFSFQQQQGSVRSNLQGSVRGQAPDPQMQTHLPGEPDCTLELVEVPSVRGIKDTPQLPAAFRLLRRGLRACRAITASSAPTADAGIPTQLLGASNPYTQLHRAERYEQPQHSQRSASAMGVYSGAAPHSEMPTTTYSPYAQLHRTERYKQPQRSASALGVYSGAALRSETPTTAAVNPNRLSAEGQGWRGGESTNSSLRPLSVLSSGSSAGSRVSSGSSVRWAEEVVDRVCGGSKEAKEEKRKERESRRTSEGRKHTPLSDVFPGMGHGARQQLRAWLG